MRGRAFPVLAVVAAFALAACGSSTPPHSAGPSVAASPTPASAAPTPSAAAASLAPAATPSPLPAQPLDAPGRVVVLARDASLALVDADGERTVLATADDGLFAFPAWSPDGTKIAAIRHGMPERSILVFDIAGAPTGGPFPVTEVFRSATVSPFYLSWLPDSQRVSYLASEGGVLSLRLVPADGSAPTDGTGPGSLVGTGNPFYYDFVDGDRLLAHVGTGTGALLGEILLDGTAAGPSLGAPGDFRSAVVSADDAFVGSVQVSDAGASEVVVEARGGGTRHAVPVLGSAALAFSPADHTLATIGPVEPRDPSITVPVGPLRLLDPEAGTDRTLLDGTVASFWWSPDGRSIAALRVHELVPATAGRTREVRLEFVDVASGEVTSQTAVVPAQLFIDQLLSYFDQYSLSHHLWSPDSAAFLMPVRDEDGGTHVSVMYRDGRPPAALDGQAAFWSPAGD